MVYGETENCRSQQFAGGDRSFLGRGGKTDAAGLQTAGHRDLGFYDHRPPDVFRHGRGLFGGGHEPA